jgi:thiamine biosynthesis lipoprotein
MFRLLISLVALSLCSCGPKSQTVLISGQTMGTAYQVKAVLDDSQSREHIKARIDDRLYDFDLEMSNWNPKSWVTAFNKSQSTDWQDIGESALEVIAMAQEVSRASGGAFDITISPLIECWGFGVKGREGIPHPEEIEGIRAYVGFDKILLDKDRAKIRKLHPQTTLNTSALAKGYGVDLLSGMLLEFGVENFMVEIGGEVRCQGKPMKRDTWSIGLQRPQRGVGVELQGTVPLRDLSMATSGDYRNFYKRGHDYYSHIIDPRSGYPVEHALCSATVTAPSCALADALATCFLVLGTQESLSLIAGFEGCSVFLVERKGAGEFQSFQNASFKFTALP